MSEESPLVEIMYLDTVNIIAADNRTPRLSGRLPVPGRRQKERGGVDIYLLLDKTMSSSGKTPVTKKLNLPQAELYIDEFARVITRVPKRTIIPGFGDVEIEVMPYTPSTTNESIHL